MVSKYVSKASSHLALSCTVGYVDLKRRFPIEDQKRAFSITTFAIERSDPRIQLKNSLGGFRRDAWIGFLDRLFFFNFFPHL